MRAPCRRDVVRMGSTVTFTSDDGQTRTLKLVYPVEESLDEHLHLGDDAGRRRFGWPRCRSVDQLDGAVTGRRHELTVMKVKN